MFSAAKAFENRSTQKYYLALARGHLEAPYVHVNLGIGPDLRPEWINLKMASESREYCGKARDSVTQIVVLSRGLYDGQPATKVRGLSKPQCIQVHSTLYAMHLNV